jgi:hypothetical protein
MYSIAYVANWLFTQHLSKVHDLVAKNQMQSSFNSWRGGPYQQDHIQMNAPILNDAHAIQQQNDQKVIAWVHTKTHVAWDHL